MSSTILKYASDMNPRHEARITSLNHMSWDRESDPEYTQDLGLARDL